MFEDTTNLLFWGLWECLTNPIKIMVPICSKLSYFSACKKSTSSLKFFLWYCEEIANLLFCVIWACLATQTPKMIKAIWRNLFIFWQKIKFILELFFEILQRYCKLTAFGTLGMHDFGQTQSDTINLQKTFAILEILQWCANLFWIL